MAKFIFVTGGVVSSLGKGITGASIGKLLQLNGLSVTMIKCDPYINVDAGTMNPIQHGEVYVTDDGAETDLDLGYYERFLEIPMTRANNVTAGSVYRAVIEKERSGKYLGSTVQVIPHITNEIKERFKALSKDFDVTIVEIGGTVGDIESLPFLEAARQMRLDCGQGNVIYVHVTLVPYIPSSDELKTKPTQHSVNKLREIGIDPNMIICRASKPLDADIKAKISLFCSVPREAVLDAPDAPSIYLVPEILHSQGVNEQILMLLGIRAKRHDFAKWSAFTEKIGKTEKTVNIALAGKYVKLKDAYKSVGEALFHGGIANNAKVRIDYVDVEDPDAEARLRAADGVLVPGGFGNRGIEGKIRAITIAREMKKPFLGICLGMQCAVIESARSLAGMPRANSTEFDEKTPHPVIDVMPEQKDVVDKGGTMRLGACTTLLSPGSAAAAAYKTITISERHRHRYEFNPKFVKALEKKGLKVTGWYKDRKLPETVELAKHPWFVGVQFHPELKSRPTKPHPLFVAFIEASLKAREGKKEA
ncbi:MAG: CTP synthase [Elusimicrobiales bacterium]|nr:CTP synthase [Elusimicrobiales bacterium]